MLEDLRLLVLIVAIVGCLFLILGIIGRKTKKKIRTTEFEQIALESGNHQERYDTSLLEDIDEFSDSASKKQRNQPKRSSKIKRAFAKKTQEEFLTVVIRSRHKGGFRGRTLELALENCGFRFGEKNIFHRYLHDNPEKKVLYSVAQSVEPGTFDRDNLKNQRVPGILIFMILPLESENPLNVFEQMLKNARQLAANLNGELCDSQHTHLSAQTIAYYRERVQENHLKRLAAHAK